MPIRYFLGVASHDHVKIGIREGFIQLGHGRKRELNRLSIGDYLVYYSPRETMDKKSKAVQGFTAVCKISSEVTQSDSKTV